MGAGAILERSSDCLPAVVLGGKLIWCCYVSVIVPSNHITGLRAARNNRREHSRYQRGATKIDCLFRYRIETLLLGDANQPSPHFPLTRPCFTHCASQRYEISASDGVGSEGSWGVWVAAGSWVSAVSFCVSVFDDASSLWVQSSFFVSTSASV